MCVYREKGAKVYTMDFRFKGQRIRETTHQTSITRAKEVEEKRRVELKEGRAGIRRRKEAGLFSTEARDWLDGKRSVLAPRSVVIEEFNLSHLLPVFGKKLVMDIAAKDIAAYQKKRLAEEASPRTANLEVGTLRAILKEHGAWERLQKKVPMLPLGEEIGRAISAAEEKALLDACGKSRSRSLLPFVVLAIETGARFNTLRTLQWRNVNFEERSLRFGKDKTKAGTGRVIPLNQRALGILTYWASQFPDRNREHYVFPSEKVGLDGEAGYLTGAVTPYDTKPEKPMGSWKTAWNHARKLAGEILYGEEPATDNGVKVEPAEPGKDVPPLACRFHDLRHTFCTRAINAGVPITKIAKLVGWQPSTMVAMAGRYGHHGLEDLRSAVETVSRVGNEEIAATSPVKSPVVEDDPAATIQ